MGGGKLFQNREGGAQVAVHNQRNPAPPQRGGYGNGGGRDGQHNFNKQSGFGSYNNNNNSDDPRHYNGQGNYRGRAGGGGGGGGWQHHRGYYNMSKYYNEPHVISDSDITQSKFSDPEPPPPPVQEHQKEYWDPSFSSSCTSPDTYHSSSDHHHRRESRSHSHARREMENEDRMESELHRLDINYDDAGSESSRGSRTSRAATNARPTSPTEAERHAAFRIISGLVKDSSFFNKHLRPLDVNLSDRMKQFVEKNNRQKDEIYVKENYVNYIKETELKKNDYDYRVPEKGEIGKTVSFEGNGTLWMTTLDEPD